MTPHIEQLYVRTPRFDEGDLYRSEAYSQLSVRQMQLLRQAAALFGEDAAKLLEDYAEVLYDQAEMECRHFFRQGYIAGRSEMIPSSRLG